MAGPDHIKTSDSGRSPFLSLFPSIMLPMFLAMIDQTIVATALPAIAEDLGNFERLSWIMVAYLVAATISAPAFGSLGDNFGRRKLLIVALGIVFISTIACALSTSVEMLVAARLCQGLGGGGLMTLSHALIGESVPPRERGRYQGYLASVVVTASMFGPVAGGFLSERIGWQAVFLVSVPITALAAFLVWRLPIRKMQAEHFRFDYFGLLLFGAFVVSTLAAMEQVQNPNDMSYPALAGLLVAMAASVLALIRWEQRAITPLLPIKLLSNPSVWRSDALAACHGATFVSLITFVPIYLCVVQGVSASEAGVLMLPMTIGIAFGSMITGRIVSMTGWTAVFPSFGLVAVTLSLLHLAWNSSELSPVWASISLAVTSVFLGTVMNVVQVTVQSAAGPRMLGLASASVQFSRSLGAALGTALVGAVVFAVLNASNPEAARIFGAVLGQGPEAFETVPLATRNAVQGGIAYAFQAGFLTMAAFAALAMPLAWTLPLRRI